MLTGVATMDELFFLKANIIQGPDLLTGCSEVRPFATWGPTTPLAFDEAISVEVFLDCCRKRTLDGY